MCPDSDVATIGPDSVVARRGYATDGQQGIRVVLSFALAVRLVFGQKQAKRQDGQGNANTQQQAFEIWQHNQGTRMCFLRVRRCLSRGKPK